MTCMGQSEHLADSLSPEDARELIASGGGQAIDVRDRDGFGSGHVPGAVNIPAEDFEDRLDEVTRDDPVVVVCDTGERSAEVAARLRDQGYRAANVKGGMKGWSGDKLPLQPAEDEEFHGPRRPGPLGA